MGTHARMSRGREALLLIVSGGCLALAFPPVDFLPAAFVGLVPFFFVLRHTRATGFWSAFRPGLIAGIAFFLPLLYWLVFLSSLEMDNPVLMSGPLILLVLLQSFYWGLFSAAAVYVRSTTNAPDVITFPLLWVACEQLRSLFVLGFTWGALGYAGVVLPRTVQFASVTGVFGVSFWIVLVAVLLTEIVARPLRRAVLPGVALVVALALPAVHGGLVMQEARFDGSVRVAVIQPNIAAEKKWDEKFKSLSFDVLIELTRAAAEDQPALVVWPETATPSYLLRDPGDLGLIAGLADEIGAPILTGCPDIGLDDSEPGRARAYNSVLLISGAGDVGPKYDKIHLVPFGEAIPFETAFPILQKVNFGEADFAPGSQRVVFEIPEARFAALVCFESIFPRLVREFVDGGAEFLVNVTNDVWYGRTSMPFQHASMVVMRAVENRRSVARSANSGVSLFVDPHGRLLSKTPIFERRFIVCDLPIVSESTFYARRGDVFAWTVTALAGLLILAPALGRLTSRGRRRSPA